MARLSVKWRTHNLNLSTESRVTAAQSPSLCFSVSPCTNYVVLSPDSAYTFLLGQFDHPRRPLSLSQFSNTHKSKLSKRYNRIVLLSLTILGLTEAGGFIIPVFRFMSAHKHRGAAGSIDSSFLPWLRAKKEKEKKKPN